ncbi:MAG: hypothetical protein LBD37_00895 [Treponema sp.]|jgi:hypothetical protein|nr:hypothetical protein [Treponema sp.]
MNIIPSIFNHVSFAAATPTYTAVGGAERAAFTGLSAVLLNRGGRYPRRTLFQELEKIGFDYIISIEGPQERYDLEDLSGRFPFVRFILLKEAVTLGEQINLAVSELNSPLFFVLWNDIRILHNSGAARMAERLFSSKEELARTEHESPVKRLCTVPVIQNSRFETLPTLIAPAIFEHTVKSLFFIPQREGMPSLYPFDGMGIYDRDRFVRLGGFDASLKSMHWQFMDFGFRAFLWGEEIRSTQLVRISYNGEVPLKQNAIDESYRRFYLKNLAPVFRGDSSYLPWRGFFRYMFRLRRCFLQALGEYKAGRRWINLNRYRFRNDARSLADLWDHGEIEFAGEQVLEPEVPAQAPDPAPSPHQEQEEPGSFGSPQKQAKP